jgi:hypothetical protein
MQISGDHAREFTLPDPQTGLAAAGQIVRSGLAGSLGCDSLTPDCLSRHRPPARFHEV